MNVFYKILIPAIIACISIASNNAQSESFVDLRDKQAYSYSKIGKTAWMNENLNYIDPHLVSIGRMVIDSSGETGHYYLHDYASQICPEGWELPNFTQVSEYINSFEGEEQPARGGKRIRAEQIRNIQMGGFVKTIDSVPSYGAQGYMGILLTQTDSLLTVEAEDGTQIQNSYAIGLHIYPEDENKEWYYIEPTFDSNRTTFYNCRCVRPL